MNISYLTINSILLRGSVRIFEYLFFHRDAKYPIIEHTFIEDGKRETSKVFSRNYPTIYDPRISSSSRAISFNCDNETSSPSPSYTEIILSFTIGLVMGG